MVETHLKERTFEQEVYFLKRILCLAAAVKEGKNESVQRYYKPDSVSGGRCLHIYIFIYFYISEKYIYLLSAIWCPAAAFQRKKGNNFFIRSIFLKRDSVSDGRF
jgi:hypothetical protein